MKHPKTLVITLISLVLATGISSDILTSLWDRIIAKSSLNAEMQSFCFEKKRRTVGKNIDLVIKPASVSKLYTTLWSLERLGKNHRFKTNFSVKKDSLYIQGGSDPYFVTENLLFAISKLQAEGYSHFNKVIFDKNFFFNWKKSSKKIKSALFSILNTERWESSTFTALKDSNAFFKRNNSENKITIKTFSVSNIVFQEKIEIEADQIFTLSSSPLYMHLKQVNMYSNNFYSDSIFAYLGGEGEFNSYIQQKLNTSKEEIYFYTGSGLGKNYTTCRLTLRMLEELDKELVTQQLSKAQVIAVPGSDAGSMLKRFTSETYNKKIVAKTGTLNDTSSFSGFILGETALTFAIFNHTSPHADKAFVKNLQDRIVKKRIDLGTHSIAINYKTPDYLSIKDTFFE
jgi:D-alanyl-D-alanine carboxypeptidase